jgi:hypothetical protein
MGSFWSFPQIPKGPQSKGSLLIVPLMFAAFVLWLIARWLFGWKIN